MDHYREIKNSLTWHKEGKFDVELVNGIITKLNFCEPGKGPEDTGKCLNSTDYKFLQNVYSCLGDLFTFIDEENKRLGYSYSERVDLPGYKIIDEADEPYIIPAETKLRPLINYHQSEMVNKVSESTRYNGEVENEGEQDIELTA